MKNSVLIPILFAVCSLIISCSGFKSDSPGVPPVDPGGVQTTPTPTASPGPIVSVTPTPSIVPTPTQTPGPTPTPPGGPVYCGALGGRFPNGQSVIDYVQARGDSSSCIRLDDQMIRGGFAPCITCVTDGYVPPTPTPTPVPTATPWPTATPTPTPGGGSANFSSPPGGPLNCPILGGGFPDKATLISYVNDMGEQTTCIRLNDEVIRFGFAPCIDCTEPQ